MADRLQTLIDLRQRVIDATGPSEELNTAIMAAFYSRDKRYIGAHWEDTGERYLDEVWVDTRTDKWVSTNAFEFTRSQERVIALLKGVLPGWWWSIGSCCVSDDAHIAPDYNSPEHGERLKREFPLPEFPCFEEPDGRMSYGPFDGGFDVDRRPPGNVPLALLEALFDALIYIEKQKIAKGDAPNG